MSPDRWPQFSRLVTCLQIAAAPIRIVVALTATRPFNRGRAKNVGFLESGARPTDTIVFHDVDIVPVHADCTCVYRPLDQPRTVRHAYGHDHCLGGVVFIRSTDFVRADGFPNGIHRWGGEDRQLERAVMRAGVIVDRSLFVPRFTGTLFRETSLAGEIQSHRASAAEFTSKPKRVGRRLPPCNLAETRYTLIRKISRVLAGIPVDVIDFV